MMNKIESDWGGSGTLRIVKMTAWSLLAITVAAATTAHSQVTFAGSQLSLASGTWSKPSAIAVDAAGDLFVADAGTGSVVELAGSSNGFLAPTTVVSDLANPSALAIDSRGNLFVADSGNGRIIQLPAVNGGFDAAVTVVSGLGSPAGMAFDASGNLFFADSANDVVMRSALAAGTYSAPVVVGSGFSSPMGVAFDPNGDMYIADTGNHRIALQRYSAGTFAAPISFMTSLTPVAIWGDRAGDLFVADSSGQRVFETSWLPSLSRYGAGIPIGSLLSLPSGVIADFQGNTYITDAETGSVWEVVTSTISFAATSVGSSGPAIVYNFTVKAGTKLGQSAVLMQGAEGKDFVSAGVDTCSGQTFATTASCGITVRFAPLDSGARYGALEIFDNTGNSLATTFLHGSGIAPHATYIPGVVTVLASGLNAPGGVAVDGNGNVFISDTGNNRVLELPYNGQGYGAPAPLSIKGLNLPEGLAVDGAGNLYVASYGNDLVIRYPWLGTQFGAQSKIGTGLYGPSSIAVDTQGNVYVAETLAQVILDLPWSGNAFLADSFLNVTAREPVGVAVGGNGNLVFSCPYTNAIFEVLLKGPYGNQLWLRSLQSTFPSQMTIDGNNNLFILDSARDQVSMSPWLGTSYGAQVTVASGLNAPQGLAIDSQGALYVADMGNNRVLKVDLTMPGTLTFAATYVGSTNAGGAQSAMVENTGDDVLNVESESFPSDFPETSASTCAAGESLAAGYGCKLTANFSPLGPGNPLIESLNVSFSSATTESQAAFTLSGMAIPQIAQSISFPSIAATVYGSAPAALAATASSGLRVQYQVISGPGVIVKSGAVYSLRFAGAGAIVVEATQSGNMQYQAAASVLITVNVSPAVATIVPSNTSTTYGSLPTSFSYTISGTVNGDNPSVVISGRPALATTATLGGPVGAYPITASQGTLAAVNYVFAYASGVLTVNEAALQVSAVSVSHVYGSPMPAMKWTITGFVAGDGASVVSGAPVVGTLAYVGSSVGSYSISISSGSLSAANYSFVLHAATLAVTPATLTVTAASMSTTYGQPIPGPTYSIAGYVNGDLANVVNGTPVIAVGAGQSSSAGSYPVTCSTGTLNAANYSFRCINGTVTIQKAKLTVTPDQQAMTYGAAVPTFTYQLSGFANSDSALTAVTGTPLLSSSATSRSHPGSYSITSTAGTLSANNYTFSFGAGTITISKAILSVSAQPANTIYGSALPSLQAAFTGFVNGDSAASALAGAPSLSTTASSKSAAGSYAITVSQGTLASSLYSFQFVTGTIAIAQAPLTVTANNLSMAQGSALPALTYSASGLVNGDTLATATTGMPSLSTNANASSAAGTYAIVIAGGTMSSTNYQLTFTSGVLTVTPSSGPTIAKPAPLPPKTRNKGSAGPLVQ